MSILLKTVAAGIIAVGLAASGAYAEQDQTTSPQGSQMGSGMQQHGMVGMPGGMMGRSDQSGAAESNGMPNMMGQLNQMMAHCNEMMSSHMQPPNSQFPKPEQPPKG
jgi:type IV secretory pathway TrbL component